MYIGTFRPQGLRSPEPGSPRTNPGAYPRARLLQPVPVVAVVIAVIGGFRQREDRGAAHDGLHRAIAIAVDVPVDVAIGLGPRSAILLIVLLALTLVGVRVLILLLLELGRTQDAEIVLGMLEIVLRHHPVAGRVRIARHLQVFFVHMRSGAADFDFRPARIEGPVRIVVVTAATTTATIVVLRPAAASTRAFHVIPFIVRQSHARQAHATKARE